MRVLVFDLYGDFAHFRKYYTTTSPLTFSFPPPPTIAGIMGAIYGASRDKYLSIFDSDNCRIAIRILNPIRKTRMGLNLINTKDNKTFQLIRSKYHEPRTQIRTEFVINPAYRIYVYHQNNDVFEKLLNLLKSHRAHYTISLGLSELLANFRFIGTYEAEEINYCKSEITTVVSVDNLSERGIEIEPGKKFFKEKIPLRMSQDRVVEKYVDVVYEAEGNNIVGYFKKTHKISNGETITFF